MWELPYATRKDLPALQVTMQVYSEEPAKRFVILNDARQAEGAELGKGLYLREIRQDGLVLEIDGTRFFYPRGGR
jgi:general secretion pathway protein B